MNELSKLYYVNVGNNGTFRPSGNPSYNTTPRDMDAIFSYLEQNGTRHIVLNFHGGLVGASTGIKGADDFRKTLAGSHLHPISFVWETGPIETILQNIKTFFGNRRIQEVLENVLKVLNKVGQKSKQTSDFTGPAAEPVRQEPGGDASIVNNNANKSAGPTDALFLEDFQVDKILQEMLSEINAVKFDTSELTADERGLINLDALPNKGNAGFKNSAISNAQMMLLISGIATRVIKRLAEKRDHQPYPTVIEEICRELLLDRAGVWLWGGMKDKAKEMWASDASGVSGIDLNAGNYLLTKLRAYCARYPDVQVDLVGHSAGSIAICEMIKTLISRDINEIKIRHVLFMAPACRCDLFYQSVIAYSSRITSFRMFTMNDQLELDDFCIKVLYPNSLLYLISGILEPNEYDAYILGMQRYLLNNPPYDKDPLLDKVMDFLSQESNRVVYAKTGAGALQGLITDCDSHGGFNDFDKPTMRSIAYILKN